MYIALPPSPQKATSVNTNLYIALAPAPPQKGTSVNDKLNMYVTPEWRISPISWIYISPFL